MKQLRYIVVTMFAFVAGATYFFSCNPDLCVQRATNCQNSGVCRDGKCICPNGFEGDSCQFFVNEKFQGRFGGFIVNSNGNDMDDSVIVIPSELVKDRIDFYFEKVPYITYTARVNNNDIVIDEHKPVATPPFVNNYTYHGTGSLNGKMLTLDMSYDSIANGLKYNSGYLTYIGRRK